MSFPQRPDPNEELKKILQSQVSLSKQVTAMGKNLLDLTKIVHDRLQQTASPTPSSSEGDSTTYPVSNISMLSHHSQPMSLVLPSQGIVALFVEGDYRHEWANLSNNLFQLNIGQASIPGDPSIFATTDNDTLARFDLIFFPYSLDHTAIRSIQMQMRSLNYRSVFVAVTEDGHGQNFHMAWDQWFNDAITASASIFDLQQLIHRHFEPLHSQPLI